MLTWQIRIRSRNERSTLAGRAVGWTLTVVAISLNLPIVLRKTDLPVTDSAGRATLLALSNLGQIHCAVGRLTCRTVNSYDPTAELFAQSLRP